MFPLDSKTVDRVAKIVVDHGGAYERSGRELAALLRDAGWADPPDYDGSPRVAWVVEALTERREVRSDVERLLCRVCDPIEYSDGMPSAELARQEINRVLEHEGLEVTYAGGRPVVGERGANGTTNVVLHLDDVQQRLRKLIGEEQLVELLVSRVRQSQLSEASGSYLLALFGIGSFVEGLLYSVLIRNYPELETAGFVNQRGQKVAAGRAGLELLIDTAHDRGLIQLDAKNFMNPVRDFRNYIHPRRQFETGFTPDGDTVAMCWPPVQALLNDLDTAAGPSANGTA
jgi:hypothetical protein